MLSKEETSDCFNYPVYSSDSTNNGIIGYTDNPEFICDENTPVYITFGDHTRTLNIAEKSFSVLDNVKVLVPCTNNILSLLFIISTWQKQIPNLGYSRHWKVAKECILSLPVTSTGEIDFDFMESFIRELEEERIRELAAYLTVSCLADATLTANEEASLLQFKDLEWQEFRIGDLYAKVELNNKKFDKRRDTRSEQSTEFPLPVVNAKHGDNGIMFYGSEDVFDSEEMTIDIVQNGAIATGDVYPQPQRTGVLWDAYLIKAINHNDTRQSLFFIAASIRKSIKLKFFYEFKATWDRVQEEYIYLPTKNGKPDYEAMETFISAVQKLVIKDVVKYADDRIAAAKDTVYKIPKAYGETKVAEAEPLYGK